ncbi:excitatory amino acid transporter 3-like [Pseudoliparis swirei]|uniref:excitatory amino acid transporter 3-like n=1 Tax=Pseudoliparis swirei TaxID=2059687 RepID=UPI0024BEF31E|nr:excitatory amino acid transporter 3-like [Pseudoliparis swirei]
MSVLGTALGFCMKTFRPYSDESQYYLRLPGELLMGSLQTVSLPLMVTSVILGIINLRAPMKIALRAAFIFVLTTVVAVLIGLMLVLVIKPGAAYTEDEDDQQVEVEFAFMDSLIDLVRNVLPSNVMRASFKTYKTTRLRFANHSLNSNSSLKTNDSVVQLEGHYVDGTNTLGLIVSALLTGVTLKSMGKVARFWPFGLISMIASNIFAVYDLETMHKLREFVLVVIVGLLIHGCVALPALYCLLVRQNLWHCIKGIFPALLTALMISSSSATVPVTLRCCVERNDVDRRIARFTLPIATTVNMDGSALYEVVAVVFLAQLSGIELGLSRVIEISVLAGISSLSAAGIPATGAVTTLFVLEVAGLPTGNASILFAVEWILDCLNTVVNVWSDCICVEIVNALSQRELEDIEQEEQTPSDDVEGRVTPGSAGQQWAQQQDQGLTHRVLGWLPAGGGDAAPGQRALHLLLELPNAAGKQR